MENNELRPAEETVRYFEMLCKEESARQKNRRRLYDIMDVMDEVFGSEDVGFVKSMLRALEVRGTVTVFEYEGRLLYLMNGEDD